MLRIAIPKGSLEEETYRLFRQANLPIIKGDERDYNLRVVDPRIEEVFLLRPQEIPKYVEEGEFDVGITGYDWVIERESVVELVADLPFSKQGSGKVKLVLATEASNEVDDVKNISDNARVVTEYPNIAKRFFKKYGKGKISVRSSYGATEVKVPRLAEYLIDVTETGETLRKNNKKILAVVLESTTQLIANKESWANPQKRIEIEEIASLFRGVISARGKTLIKMNIDPKRLEGLLDNVYFLRSPTISSLASGQLMVETVVEKSALNIIIPVLKQRGATDILEIEISKMIE